MVKEKLTYKDFNGATQHDDLYFNLTKIEMVEFNARYGGDLVKYMDKVDDTQQILMVVELIDRAYGLKSDDGKSFLKNPEILQKFKQSAAYEAFYDQMLANTKRMEKFVQGLFKLTEDEFKKAKEDYSNPKLEN